MLLLYFALPETCILYWGEGQFGIVDEFSAHLRFCCWILATLGEAGILFARVERQNVKSISRSNNFGIKKKTLKIKSTRCDWTVLLQGLAAGNVHGNSVSQTFHTKYYVMIYLTFHFL